MNFDDHFRDLAPLDPRRDPEHWEATVSAIMAAAAPDLARRAAIGGPNPSLLLASWMRPAVSFAAALAAVAGVALALNQPAPTITAAPGIATALGVSAPVSTWVETGQASSIDELALALAGGVQ